MRFYEFDKQRVYTGNSMEHNPKVPIPRNWTHVPPPEGPGVHIFDGVKWFTREERPAPPPRPEPERRVTKGRFFDLFGDQKLAILTSNNPVINALIQDVVVREYVVLTDPQVVEGLELLVELGYPIDIDRILSGQLPEDSGDAPA